MIIIYKNQLLPFIWEFWEGQRYQIPFYYL